MPAQTFLQAGNTAGMHQTYGNVAGAGMLHGLSSGFMGNFVGKDDNGVRRADFVLEVALIAMNALEGRTPLASCRDIFLLQPVHTADQRHAHACLRGILPCGPGHTQQQRDRTARETDRLRIIENDFQSQENFLKQRVLPLKK